MPEVTICTENVVIHALGAGMMLEDKRLEKLSEYFIQHLSGCLPLLIQQLQRNIAVLDWNRQESDHHDAVR